MKNNKLQLTSQAWQYQRRRCRPLDLSLLPKYFVEPTSALGILTIYGEVFEQYLSYSPPAAASVTNYAHRIVVVGLMFRYQLVVMGKSMVVKVSLALSEPNSGAYLISSRHPTASPPNYPACVSIQRHQGILKPPKSRDTLALSPFRVLLVLEVAARIQVRISFN
jgi:hypothetical protein